MDQNPTANHLTLESFHFQERKLVISYFPGSSVGKDFAFSAGDLDSIPGSERSPGEGNGSPLQCSCLENPMDRGAWQAPWVTRVGHNLVTQPSPPIAVTSCFSYQNMLTYIV